MNADTPDNVVELGNRIADHGEQTKAAGELEQRRKILFRAFDLAAQQMERDAQEMVKSGIVGEHDIPQRLQMMDTARCLLTSVSWLRTLLAPAAAPAEPQDPATAPANPA